ncbi:hypothetical protein [Pseudonocardia sp.]|uniref:hypothetical protein n=1 Tax=Pseudonocardia sp. TaxID=60912 RepID=UPI0026371435|nr:hypothetical protein [Pseudonocardia sp.]
MNADDEANFPVGIPAQRGSRGGPSPRDIPAQRAVTAPVRRVPAPYALAPSTAPEPGTAPSDPIRDHARSEVLHRYARLTNSGRPVFCTPSQAEIAGVVALRQGRGTDGKVIYPTREAAEAAARELEGLGARALRSYLCGRSRSGHFHLATDTSQRPLTPAEVHARIPRQQGSLSA